MDSTEESFKAACAHHRAGRLREAEALYRLVIESNPANAEAHHLLGIAIAAQGRADDAISSLRGAINARPNYPEAFYNLGKVLQDAGHSVEAAESYRTAISQRPAYPAAHNNLGIVLQSIHDFIAAEASYRAAIHADPSFAEAHYNFANVLKEQNRLDDAVAFYRRAIKLKPDYADALINLGNVLQRMGHLDEASALFRSAVAINPNLPTAQNSLGNAAKDAGRLSESIECYRRAITTGGGNWAWDNLLYALHFHPDYDATRIAREHSRWNDQVILPHRKRVKPYSNDRSADRPLNIAYVSPDLREHPVGRFMLPLLANHSRDTYRIHCYSDARFPDALSHILRSHADVWRDTEALNDDQLVEQIRNDQIDVLIDLTMHMEGNRLLAFAQSPAPVQATYLAYCSTTGLSAMNYRLTDPHLDPPDGDDSVYSEISIHLPKTYWCYQPSPNAGDVAPLPAQANGCLTFGCVNNYSKVTPRTWEMWFAILKAVPNSRLLVQSPQDDHREEPLEIMKSRGLDPDRLTFVDRVPIASYFKFYNQIDIALDPFPYGGGTTTCDALWMGVPVISLAGRTAVSRGGLSLLTNIGFPNWVAGDPAQYVRIAVDLANDIPNMSALRSTLRQHMLASPLMDAPSFARDVEAAYRKMWMRWCQSPSIP